MFLCSIFIHSFSFCPLSLWPFYFSIVRQWANRHQCIRNLSLHLGLGQAPPLVPWHHHAEVLRSMSMWLLHRLWKVLVKHLRSANIRNALAQTFFALPCGVSTYIFITFIVVGCILFQSFQWACIVAILSF